MRTYFSGVAAPRLIKTCPNFRLNKGQIWAVWAPGGGTREKQTRNKKGREKKRGGDNRGKGRVGERRREGERGAEKEKKE